MIQFISDWSTVRNTWLQDDRKNGKNGKNPVRSQSPITLQSVGNHQNRPNRGASQHPSNSGSPLVRYFFTKCTSTLSNSTLILCIQIENTYVYWEWFTLKVLTLNEHIFIAFSTRTI